MLSDESVKGQKFVLSAVRAAGGAHNVAVTSTMLTSVKNAHSKKMEDERDKNEKKRKAEEDAEYCSSGSRTISSSNKEIFLSRT